MKPAAYRGGGHLNLVIKIAVLVSGGGTNLQAIIDEVEDGNILGSIDLVVSEREDAFAMERAKKHGIEVIYIGKKNFPDMMERNNKLLELLLKKDIDLVVLAGYMSILGKQLIKAFENRIINVHPSLIPSFCGKGFYGDKVHEAVLDYGSKISGATVHFVDEGTDTGAIILQEAVEVLQSDTVETLGKRVLEVEHRLLPRAIKLFSENRLMIEGRRVMINIEGQRG